MRGRGAPGDLRARAEAGRGAAARDAHQAVPHGDRRSTSTAAPSGSSRSRTCSRRSSGEIADEYDVEMPAVEHLRRRLAAGPGAHADRRGERGARHGAARHGVGHRRRARLQPPRVTCPRRARRCASRASSSAPSGCRVTASSSVRITPLASTADDAERRARESVDRSPARDASDRSAPGSSRSSGDPTSGSRRSSTASSAPRSRSSPTARRPRARRSAACAPRPTSQLVLLDTPGIHKPRTLLGERTNDRARSTLAEVDVVCLLVEATGDHRSRRPVRRRARAAGRRRRRSSW